MRMMTIIIITTTIIIITIKIIIIIMIIIIMIIIVIMIIIMINSKGYATLIYGVSHKSDGKVLYMCLYDVWRTSLEFYGADDPQ